MAVTDLHPAEAPEVPEVPAGSLLEHLAAKRAELVRREPREEVKLIPEWEGALRVVYRYPEEGSDAILRAATRIFEAEDDSERRDASCDVLIACCHRIEGRVPGGEWESLDTINPQPVRFNRRLAGLLHIDVPEKLKSPARWIVRNVFSPRAESTGEFEGDVAMLAQAGQLLSWLQGAERLVDEGLRGE